MSGSRTSLLSTRSADRPSRRGDQSRVSTLFDFCATKRRVAFGWRRFPAVVCRPAKSSAKSASSASCAGSPDLVAEMTSTNMYHGLQDGRKSSKVLKPPGGGSSDIFGAAPEETSPRRVKTHNQSQLGSALFGDANGTDNASTAVSPRTNKPGGSPCVPARNPVTGDGIEVTPVRRIPRKCRDGNPVTGTGYASDAQKNGPVVQNGTASSNSSSSGEKSNDTSPMAKPRTRVPPGGYSSGLW